MVSRCAGIFLGGVFLLFVLQLLTVFHLEMKANRGQRIFPVNSYIVRGGFQSLIPFWKDSHKIIGTH